MSTRTDDVIDQAFSRMRIRSVAEMEARHRAEMAEHRRKVDTYLIAKRFPARCVMTKEFRDERWIRSESRLAESVMSQGPSTWLLIGTRGGGKSTMATCCAREVVMAGGRVRFSYLPELLDMFRESATTALKQMGSVTLLVIDDIVGDAMPTAWQRDALTSIIRRRHDNDLATVMTGNATKSAAVARLGPTIASRLSQGGIIVCDWPSFRHGKRETEANG